MTGNDAAKIRKHFGLSQQKMAVQLGYVSHGSIGHIEYKREKQIHESAEVRYREFAKHALRGEL